MTANITEANEEVVHCLTYRGIEEDDKSNQLHISLGKDFDNSIIEIFGPDISPDDFTDVGRHLCMTCMMMIPWMRRIICKTRVRTMRYLL